MDDGGSARGAGAPTQRDSIHLQKPTSQRAVCLHVWTCTGHQGVKEEASRGEETRAKLRMMFEVPALHTSGAPISGRSAGTLPPLADPFDHHRYFVHGMRGRSQYAFPLKPARWSTRTTKTEPRGFKLDYGRATTTILVPSLSYTSGKDP